MISPRQANDLGHQIAMQLRGAYAHLRRSSNQAFAPYGMTSDQYVLLTVLAQDGAASQQELVQRAFSDTATVAAMLVLLETKGLITRRPHPRDRRARRVELTPAGSELTKELWRHSAGLRVRFARRFAEPELRTLIEYLQRLGDALQPPGGEPRSAPPNRRGRSAFGPLSEGKRRKGQQRQQRRATSKPDPHHERPS